MFHMGPATPQLLLQVFSLKGSTVLRLGHRSMVLGGRSASSWGIRSSRSCFQGSFARIFVAGMGTWLFLCHWWPYAEVHGLLEALRCPLHTVLASCLKLSSLGLTMSVNNRYAVLPWKLQLWIQRLCLWMMGGSVGGLRTKELLSHFIHRP